MIRTGRMMMKIPATAIAFLVVVFCGAIASCDRHPSDTPPPPPKRHVLATVYPLSDIVRQVAGDMVDVEWFCEYGLDPRDLKLSDEQNRRARNADLLVTSGFDDVWAGESLDQRQRGLRMVRP